MKFKLEQFLKDRTLGKAYPGSNSYSLIGTERITSIFKETHKQHLTRYSGASYVKDQKYNYTRDR